MQQQIPIIIIFERHWDKVPKQVLKEMFLDLSKQGYNTFCVEAPQDLTEQDYISRLNSSIAFDQSLYSDAKRLLTQAGIKVAGDISDLNYGRLVELMRLYVSSKKYVEVAEKIKNLPALLLFAQILEEARQLSVPIVGVDIDAEKYDSLLSNNLLNRTSDLDKNESYRNATIGKNLEFLYKKGNGVIFLCGAVHANAVVSYLKEKNGDSSVISYFPHSQKLFDDSSNDIEFLKKKDSIITQNAYCISNENDMASFVEKVKKDISDLMQPRVIAQSTILPQTISYWRKVIEGNSQTSHLARQYGANFEAYQQENYYVDALLPIDEQKITTQEAENIKNKLEENKIFSRYTFFNETKYLVIPKTNEREVGDNIMKIGLN